MNGKNQDWTGNRLSRHATMVTRNHAKQDRETNDYYRTEPRRVELLLQLETFDHHVWECACGRGHISDVLIKHGYDVRSTDLIDRGYGVGGVDFLKQTEHWNGDIITNPPYKYRLEFLEKSFELINDGRRVCMLLKLQFLESKRRYRFFKRYPPKVIYVSTNRLSCRLNAEFEKYRKMNRITYAWFIWEKGFHGDPVIKWFNY